MKAVLIFFGIALTLIALLFWAKMQPATALPRHVAPASSLL